MSRTPPRDERSIEHFGRAFASRSPKSPRWLAKTRQQALDRFLELGLPTTRAEEWRYTNISKIAELAPLPVAEHDARSVAIRSTSLPKGAGQRLVFVDGHYRADLSTPETKEGLTLRPLAECNESAPPRFGHLAGIKDEAFTGLNTAFVEDGAVVQLAADTILSEPLHLLFIATADAEQPRASFPRVSIDVGENAHACIVQDHLSLAVDALEPAGAHFTNAVSEVRVGENASIRMLLVQREGERALHVARQAIEVARDGRFTIHTLNLGGALVRNDLEIALVDEGAECQLFGLSLGGANQLHDNHTRVDHAMPRCRSREFYKAVLGGNARNVFRGRVIVRPDAQHTDAEQQNRSILLSKHAEVDAKPQLEIYADDVRCSHGSSIGQLDLDALFFLRARGLDRQSARILLTQGFANEITDTLPEGAIGDEIRGWVGERLPQLFPPEES